MAKKPSVGAGRRASAKAKAEKSSPPAPARNAAPARSAVRKASKAADPEVTTRPAAFDPDAYKFVLTPPNAPAAHQEPEFEYLGELPDSYGTRKLFLVARDPHFLFSYWDFTEGQFIELSQRASDGNVFLQLYLDNGEKLQQIQANSRSRSWYLQANRPGASFYAELGVYRDGKFEVAARSAVITAPPDTVSWRTDAKFVTLPFHLPFRVLLDLIRQQMRPGEELVDALARLQEEGFEFPFDVARTGVQGQGQGGAANGVYDYLGEEVYRRIRVGSHDITEVLRRRLEQEKSTSSGQWPGSSLSSPFGGKQRGFFMNVNAELIIYGGTDPKAKVRIAGQDIQLREDGTFTFHFNLPDGQFHIPVEAEAPDKQETRSALLSFLRMSDHSGDVKQTPQTPRPEPFGRQG